MKIYNVRKKDGTPVNFGIYDRHIYHETTSDSLPDIMYKIDNKYNKIKNTNKQFIPASNNKNVITYKRYDWYDYPSPNNTYDKFTVTKYNKEFYYTRDKVDSIIKPSEKIPYFFKLDKRPRSPICVLRDNGGNITSDYGYTYNDLRNMLLNNDYNQYIKDNDYIELIIDNRLYHMRFNIDTYYGRCYKDGTIPHHIDMISDEILHFGQPQYLDVWDKTLGKDNPTNTIAGNGSSSFKSIFKRAGDKLWADAQTKLSNTLKSYIIEKTAIIYDRQIGNSASSISNYDIPIGYTWQLREGEILGYSRLSNLEADSNTCIQYPSCKYIGIRRQLSSLVDSYTDGIYNSYITWSLLDNQNATVYVVADGYVGYDEASQSSRGKLLCFRFA